MNSILFQLILVFVLGAFCQWISWRLRFPTIIVLLISGLLAGPVFDILKPDQIFGELLFPLVSLAVAIILFEGGLDLHLKELKGKSTTVFSLVTVGCFVNWVLITFAARQILGMEMQIAMLLGGILTVSGPTVVQPLIRFIRPREPIYSILKWEGILIDPVGAVLAVLILEDIFLSKTNETMAPIFFGLLGTLVVGAAIGYLVGKLFVYITKHSALPDELYSTSSLACLFFAFYFSNMFYEEAGLVAVTVMGIIIGNETHPAVRHVTSFKEDLRVLLISSLFIVLAARVDINLILNISIKEFLFIGFIVIIARPASVITSTMFQGLATADRIFLCWMFPRGIVAAAISSLFAIELQHHGIAGGDRLFAVVFITILATVVIYGVTGALVARLLGVSQEKPRRLLLVGINSFTRELANLLVREKIDFIMVDTNLSKVHNQKLDGIPAVHTNILSADGLEAVDIDNVHYSVSLTSNDEANALISIRLEKILGYGKSLQTPPIRTKATNNTSIDEEYRGNFFPRSDLPIMELSRLIRSGAQIKAVNMSEKFNMDNLKENYTTMIPLFSLRNNRLKPYKEDGDPSLTPEDKLIFIGVSE